MSINDIISKYIDLRAKKEVIDLEIDQLEQQLSDYCHQNKMKTLKFKDQTLCVVQKSKTVFPSLSDPQRKKLEATLKSFAISNNYKTIDITRLASAYDANKLPPDLMAALKPLATTKPFIRVTLISRKTN